MAGIRGTSHPESPELLQRLQNIERILGITGQNVGNGPGVPNSQEITGQHKIRDANGLLRVVVGQLPSGDYGYYTADPNGVAKEIWPTSSASGLTASAGTTTSSAFGTLASSPIVEAYLGASGDAIVDISVTVVTAATSGGGEAQLYIDGVEAPLAAEIVVVGNSLQISAACPNRLRDIGFLQTPNTTHTFSLQYRSTTNTISNSFSDATIVVQPL